MKRGRKIVMIIIGILLIAVGGLIVYWNIPYSPLKSHFYGDMYGRLEKREKSTDVVTEEDLARLPKQMQKHLRKIGMVGSKRHHVVNAKFTDVDFLFNTEKNMIVKMDYDLWLFRDSVYRGALCESRMYGVPFDGMDYMTENKSGGMKGVLGKMIQLFDQNGEQGFRAEIITWIAENAALNPCALLSDAIVYEEMDANHVKATVTRDGISGSGIFTFDDQGNMLNFYSDERQEEEIDGKMTRIGWRADMGKMDHKVDGVYLPSEISAVKIYPDGKERIYFPGKKFTIRYDDAIE